MAASTSTPRWPAIPSISARSWFTCGSKERELPRADAIASISSMNTIDGWFSLARSNRRRTFRSDSPSHMLVRSAAVTG